MIEFTKPLQHQPSVLSFSEPASLSDSNNFQTPGRRSRTPIRLPELRIDDADVGNSEKVSRTSMSNDLESAGVGKAAFN